MAKHGAQPPASNPFWLLALFIGSAMSGMHVLVPALPMIAEEFAVTPAVAQQTVSLYMLAVAGGQLVYGPVSDWFGRRPVLIAGMVVFAATGFLAAATRQFDLLLAARMLQGAGGCAGLVLGRAIVHDTSGDKDAAATISAMNAILLVSPALAPMIGLWLAQTWGWRIIPAALGLFGLVALWGSIARLRETSSRPAGTPREMATNYLRLLRLPPFLGYIIAGSLGTTTMFALLSAAPFVITERLGRPMGEVGILYTSLIVGIMVGNLIGGRLLRRFGFEPLMLAATAAGLAGAGLILGQDLAGTLTLPGFMLGAMLYTLMCGLMAPLSLTRSVDLAPTLKGSASGLYGFSQMTIGAASVMLAGLGENLLRTVGIITLSSAATSLCLIAVLKVWRDRGGRADT